MGAIQQLLSSFGAGGAPPPTDPFWTSVTSLIHMEGVNGGTTFTDQKPITWANSGSAITSTSEFKFGTSSLFNGTGFIQSTAALSGTGLGTGDFTIEGWFYATSTATRGLLDAALASSAASLAAGWDQSSGTWSIYFAGSVYSSAPTTLTLNTWTSFCLQRSGGTVVLAINGVAIITQSDASNLPYTAMNYGAYYNPAFPWIGYIDECRITKGVARYTFPYVPPVAAFPDS